MGPEGAVIPREELVQVGPSDPALHGDHPGLRVEGHDCAQEREIQDNASPNGESTPIGRGGGPTGDHGQVVLIGVAKDLRDLFLAPRLGHRRDGLAEEDPPELWGHLGLIEAIDFPFDRRIEEPDALETPTPHESTTPRTTQTIVMQTRY